MKKSTRISVPPRVVLPLAAAALLGACDDPNPGTYRMTNIVPAKSGSTAAERLRAQREREFDVSDEDTAPSSKIRTATRTNARVHHA